MFTPDPLSSSSPWVERMPSSMACFTPMTTRQSRTLLLLTARSVPGDRGLRNLLRMLQVPRPRFLVHIPPLTSWSHGQLLLALVSPSLHSLNGNHRSHIHICSYLKLSLLTPLGSHPHWRPGWWPEETLRPPDRGGLAAICLVTATAAPASWRHEATRIRDPDKREASDYEVP